MKRELSMAEKSMIEKAPSLYSQDGKGGDAICYGHYFYGAYDFWVLELQVLDNGDLYFYGVSRMYDTEYGYETRNNLRSVPMMDFEKDWEPKPLNDIPEVREGMSEIWNRMKKAI